MPELSKLVQGLLTVILLLYISVIQAQTIFHSQIQVLLLTGPLISCGNRGMLFGGTQNCGVRQLDASVRHHDHQVSHAQLEPRVPTDTKTMICPSKCLLLNSDSTGAEGLNSAIIRDRTCLHQNRRLCIRQCNFFLT
jgi:hypothetical protein